MEQVTHLKSYTTLNEDEFELETTTEAAHAIPWTESEIRALEIVGKALLSIESPLAGIMLGKVLAWRATRNLGVPA